MNSERKIVHDFLNDDNRTNLYLYEIEIDQVEDPNEQVYNYAKSQGDCPCRLWLILLLTNLTIIIVFTFLIILLLVEIGPAPPFQSYNEQCVSSTCDMRKGLVCSGSGGSKRCKCPDGNWFWYNGQKCRECPANWFVENQRTGCYFVSHTRLSYTAADRWCQEVESRLLEINGQNLFNALQMTTNFRFTTNDFYWIGLRERGANQSIYQWETSRRLFTSSNYFCSGQPSHKYNYYFQQYDQCVGLSVSSNSSSCLADASCDDGARFICELY